MNVRRSRAGFTLIELMVVIIILAILAMVVIPRVVGRTDDARVSSAITTIQSFDTALDQFKIDTGAYPTTEQGLNALVQRTSDKWNGPYLKNQNRIPLDPWGNPYVYKAPGAEGRDYEIVSQGPPDGQHPIQSWNLQGK